MLFPWDSPPCTPISTLLMRETYRYSLKLVSSSIQYLTLNKFKDNNNSHYIASKYSVSFHFLHKDCNGSWGDSGRISVRLETPQGAKRTRRLKPRPPERVPSWSCNPTHLAHTKEDAARSGGFCDIPFEMQLHITAVLPAYFVKRIRNLSETRYSHRLHQLSEDIAPCNRHFLKISKRLPRFVSMFSLERAQIGNL